MEDVLVFNSIKQYNTWAGKTTLHPLVSIVNWSDVEKMCCRKVRYDFYTVYLKKIKCGDLRYGLGYYDYEEGTLVFIGPGQVSGENKDDYFKPEGMALVFHPDLLVGTSLAKSINEEYHFFSYAVHEALHLSEKERLLILDSFSKIEFELQHPVDKHSKQLIVANIELFLSYCTRFYDRQFITRDNVNKGVVESFETLLNEYFSSDKPARLGLPSVAHFASEMSLSANYFGDLIKKETGKSAQEYIHGKMLDIAKNKVCDFSCTIGQIAIEMGFKYPQHFVRFFKQRMGCTPLEYRSSLN